jgi:hypothetical protein
VLFRLWFGATSTSRLKVQASFNRKTGAAVDPILTDPAISRPVDEPAYTLAAGPAAAPPTRQRYEAVENAASSALNRKPTFSRDIAHDRYLCIAV